LDSASNFKPTIGTKVNTILPLSPCFLVFVPLPKLKLKVFMYVLKIESFKSGALKCKAECNYAGVCCCYQSIMCLISDIPVLIICDCKVISFKTVIPKVHLYSACCCCCCCKSNWDTCCESDYIWFTMNTFHWALSLL